MASGSHVAVVFVSRRTATHDEEYARTAARMEELVRDQPGFLGMVSVRDPVTRQGITVAYFEDDESVTAWKSNAEHAAAQQRGIADFYEGYHVTVAHVTRQYGFEKLHHQPGDNPAIPREASGPQDGGS
jgi:heme-degrading monooxygenase HmoA